jgi:hypothetical protein
MSEVKDIIKMLKFHINRANNVYDGFDLEDCKLAEDAVEALEKQIPKKPAFTCNNEVIHCPNCDYDLMGGVEVDAEKDPAYCWVCGQKLDWSDSNES